MERLINRNFVISQEYETQTEFKEKNTVQQTLRTRLEDALKKSDAAARELKIAREKLHSSTADND